MVALVTTRMPEVIVHSETYGRYKSIGRGGCVGMLRGAIEEECSARDRFPMGEGKT